MTVAGNDQPTVRFVHTTVPGFAVGLAFVRLLVALVGAALLGRRD